MRINTLRQMETPQGIARGLFSNYTTAAPNVCDFVRTTEVYTTL